ncbi:MAG: LOG family protein [Steroidobacteraceae bacterium]|jgi:hypothetical protein|nr:LOG family protein [Steroidobacteraceae bacterium]
MPATPIDPRVVAILDSPGYRIAEADQAFLDSDEARPARLLLEFLRAESTLQAAHVRSTVVVFGSARVPDPAQVPSRWGRYYEEARALAHALHEACRRNGCHEFVVTTGGGPGIMEAANRGASERGDPSIGLNIDLPREQLPNGWIAPGLALRFRYFALRKMHFMLRARALVAFPGGYGTLDELFEALTLVQTGKIPRIPIVLVGSEFWRRAVDWDFLVSEGFIDAAERDLCTVVETGVEAAAVVLRHYGLAAPQVPAG